jgi:L-seryl-tRNA(Ser) seleniumtransferase
VTPAERLRQLPSVQAVAEALDTRIPWVYRVEAAQTAVGEAREALRRGQEVDAALEVVARRAAAIAQDRAEPHLRPLINATGVILHTNLGRAPLGDRVLDHIVAVSRGYSTLEFDLARGERGSRHSHVEREIVAVTGAEAGMAVNNNAAAVLLALAELARGREVVVSRGQLVEIGGAFRIPDVMAQSGAILREVGTTNKTRLEDYARAIGPDTALLLKVHTSNFRLVGFVESVETADLVQLGHAHGLPVMEDLGSGVLRPLTVSGWSEPSVAEVVAAGIDLVTFSGDKLLGGPQAGILAGRADIIARLKKNPLARALRVDKMTLAGLEMTLRLYREGRQDEIPLWRMLNATPAELKRRAANVARRVKRGLAEAGAEADVRVVDATAPVGGGSLPAVEWPTAAVSVRPLHLSLRRVEERLRAGSPPVVARVENDSVWFDLRTVQPGEEAGLAAAIVAALARPDR